MKRHIEPISKERFAETKDLYYRIVYKGTRDVGKEVLILEKNEEKDHKFYGERI